MEIQLAQGRNGAVASGHEVATREALAVLKDGGNAVDAAVAAALALTVLCPYACTLAGDAYLMIFDPRSGKIAGLNGTGRAPEAATAERFVGGMAQRGPLAASIPGLLAALQDALTRFGTRDLATLMQPALRLAEQGFTVFPYFANQVRDRQELIAQDPAASALYLPGGAPLKAGDKFVQPALAALMREIASDGVDAFYRGAVGASLAAGLAKLGGLWSADDLAAHRSTWQEPMSVRFYGHDVATMPPNSYGPTLLFQLLDLQRGAIDKAAPDSAEFVARGFAARKRAYKLAAKYVGEPDLLEQPMRKLLAAAIANGGDLDSLAAPPVTPPEARDRCTTNVTVIDRDGMAVSLIESISAPFGAGIVLEGTGVLLNNRMAGFNNDPASANCVGPRKRPAHTLAPCLVTKDGALTHTIGTPGTVGQTCVLAQVLARMLACGQGEREAAAAARWSVDFQGKLVVEDIMDEKLRAEVMAQFPETKAMRAGWISFGSLKLARKTADGLTALADRRRAAAAAAF